MSVSFYSPVGDCAVEVRGPAAGFVGPDGTGYPMGAEVYPDAACPVSGCYWLRFAEAPDGVDSRAWVCLETPNEVLGWLRDVAGIE